MGTVRMLDEVLEAPEPLVGVSQADLEAAYAKLIGKIDSLQEPDPAPVLERVVVKRAMPDKEILAAMSGLGAVLVVRLMLLAAVVGAFVLAYLAMASPSNQALAVLAIYAITIVAPLVWLSTKRT